jgi:hypothetical protein
MSSSAVRNHTDEEMTLSVLLAMSMASAAEADEFQLLDRATGARASGAAVHLNDKPLGYTDNYGRIIISNLSGPVTLPYPLWARLGRSL